MNKSKAKGTSWETRIVNFLNGLGFRAQRRVLAGAEDKGDIEILDVPIVVIEAKNEKQYHLSTYVDEANAEARHAGAPIGVAWVHRHRKSEPQDGYVIMDGSTFTEVLKLLKPDRI